MAKQVTAYQDSKGNLHRTALDATKADIAMLLGRMGEGGGISDGLAALIIDKRKELEAILAQYDEITPKVVAKAA